MVDLFTIRASTPADTARLFDIWRASVEATHDFLTPGDLAEISDMVRNAYLPVTPFWLAVAGDGTPVAFMGLTSAQVDALFVAPDQRGKGAGKLLLSHAVALAGPLRVDVNEQNAQAVGFYRRFGFVPVGRSATDSEGRPYPLLHMAMT